MTKNPQHYRSIMEFAITHRLQLPKPRFWWLLSETITGEVNGIPKLRGQAVATNGILAAVEHVDGVFFCHREWFVGDPGEPSFDQAERKQREEKVDPEVLALAHEVFV